MRLIDADALMQATCDGGVCSDCEDAYKGQNVQANCSEVRLVFLRTINEAPSIEPKRGEWVKRTHNTLIAQVNFAYCSECGQPIMHEHTSPLWNFCPNCGAKMKGADDE